MVSDLFCGAELLSYVPLLSHSGFDLCEVGQEEVVLKTGKQASRRIMHYALQSLLALFGENDTFLQTNAAKSYSSLILGVIPSSSFRLHGASQTTEHGQFLLPGVPVFLPVSLPAALFTPLFGLLPTSALLHTPCLPRQPLL